MMLWLSELVESPTPGVAGHLERNAAVVAFAMLHDLGPISAHQAFARPLAFALTHGYFFAANFSVAAWSNREISLYLDARAYRMSSTV